MKKLITLLFVLFVISGCSDDDDEIQNPLFGKWKLVEVRTPLVGAPVSIDDVSDENITYTFDFFSNLTIDTNGKKETFKYQYKIDYLTGPMSGDEPKSPIVFIDNSKYTYFSLAPNKIVIGWSYVDGSDYYLVKQ